MKLDGSLCSLPKSSAFELGVAAIAFLTVAQLVGTTAAATTMCASGSKTDKSAATRGRVASVALLVLSWYVCINYNIPWWQHIKIRAENSTSTTARVLCS